MRDDSEFRVRVERCGDGYVARGAGFYAWDEDARSLIESGLRTRRERYAPRPSGRAASASRRSASIAAR